MLLADLRLTFIGGQLQIATSGMLRTTHGVWLQLKE
jgi:hypothetical protein